MAKRTDKPDIRVQFTRKTLRDSLLCLMETESILNISIKEICERAGVSRSTFYAYYNDQFDLLRQIEKQSFTDIDTIIQKYKHSGKLRKQEILGVFQDVLQYIVDNRDSIQVLLSENGDIGYQKRIMQNSFEWIHQTWNVFNSETPDAKTIKYYSAFWVGGVLSLTQKWLKDGMDTPIPEMAKMLVSLMGGRG